MIFSLERKEHLEKEFLFTAGRSSGPGGQNVNKVNTRVELRFAIDKSENLSATEKTKIKIKLKNRINVAGELVLVAQTERSQWRNRLQVTSRFFKLLEEILTPVKRRIKTRPTSASRIKRIESKKKMGLKKQLRKPPEL
jgi:ribosome-associated protein